jgi:hypothetical protein
MGLDIDRSSVKLMLDRLALPRAGKSRYRRTAKCLLATRLLALLRAPGQAGSGGMTNPSPFTQKQTNKQKLKI